MNIKFGPRFILNLLLYLFVGDFPDIEVVAVADGPTPRVSVTENTRGSPDSDMVALTLDGSVSLPFSVATLNAGKVTEY